MLKNYFIVALRSLLRNKEYSFINVLGLSISIAACLLLFAVIRYELSFDHFHTKGSSIYRVVMDYKYPDGTQNTPGVPAPAPDAFRNDFPQIGNQATVFSVANLQINIVKDGKEELHFKEEKGALYMEPEFFEMFDFKWLHGSPQGSLNEPNLAVITRETAERYFGQWQNAVGKNIQVQNGPVLKVSGILENIPLNSDFPITVAISFKTRTEADQSWGNVTSRRQHYIQLPDQMNASAIQSLLRDFEKKHFDTEEITGRFVLQPLSEIHFDDRYGNLNGRTISKSMLFSFGVIGFFLLLTASINFINLAIAQVIKRSKEVGVRKVLGSQRQQLILQFFGETFLILILSSFIAVGIAQLSLPFLRPVLNFPPHFNPLGIVATPVFLLSVVFVLTLLSGIYPAGVMARFKPIQALKNKISNQTIGGSSLRKSLVVVQFMIAQVLVVVMLVILLQIDFFRKADPGFNREAILLFSIPTDSSSLTKFESLRNTILQQPGVEQVSFGFAAPAWRNNSRSNFSFDGSSKEEPFEVNQKFGDVNYFKTYQLEIIAGRSYQESDTAREYVVNETFLKKVGIKNPEEVLGKSITMSGRSLPVVGVVRDFHNHSFHSEIDPVVISNDRRSFRFASVKFQPQRLKELLSKLPAVYSASFGSRIFDYQFLDESMAKSYADEDRLATMVNIFSGISIFISCLGLYGLISFMAVQRTKEVGIRKVLGASATQIVILFSKEFLFLVLIAFTIAAPFAAIIMEKWLSGFVYRINMGIGIFLISIIGTLLIALITVGFQSVKAALVNPVQSLKNE